MNPRLRILRRPVSVIIIAIRAELSNISDGHGFFTTPDPPRR